MAVRADEIQSGDRLAPLGWGVDPNTGQARPKYPTVTSPTLSNPSDDGQQSGEAPRRNSAISDPTDLESPDTSAPLYNIRRQTKFGKVMNIVGPLLEGGLIGATSNSHQAGAGLQNSEAFFNHLNQMRVQARQNQIINQYRIDQGNRAEAQAKLDRERASREQETSDRLSSQPTGPVIKRKNPTTGTELARHIGADHLQSVIDRISKEMAALGKTFQWKTIPQGAATSVWAAVVAPADEIGGQYCENCHVGQLVPEGAAISGISEGVRRYALDPQNAEALWKKSEELVGESFSRTGSTLAAGS